MFWNRTEQTKLETTLISNTILAINLKKMPYLPLNLYLERAQLLLRYQTKLNKWIPPPSPFLTTTRPTASVINHTVFYPAVFPHAGPSGAYSPEATMGYMMDGQQMMHRPPTDPAFHQSYAHYPHAEYYGHPL